MEPFKQDFVQKMLASNISYMREKSLEYAIQENLTDDETKVLFNFFDFCYREIEVRVKKM